MALHSNLRGMPGKQHRGWMLSPLSSTGECADLPFTSVVGPSFRPHPTLPVVRIHYHPSTQAVVKAAAVTMYREFCLRLPFSAINVALLRTSGHRGER